MSSALDPGMTPPMPGASIPSYGSSPAIGGQSISLQGALLGALTGNPDLVALRQGLPNTPSLEAVEVARRFPTTLNPTLWIDFRPLNLVPPDPFASGTKPTAHQSFYRVANPLFYISVRQPVELGHQTTHRYNIAKAAYNQQQWTVVQAELLALVQTYRFFQTAAYRREKLRVAQELADFNERLFQSLKQRLEANQVLAADVALARVESRASRQQIKAARQDYLTALTDLRNQIGVPETAGAAEPLGEFTLPPYIPPVDEQVMIQTALENRPEIRASQALVSGTCASVRLAKADRIPSPVVGPVYEIDEVGVQYIGFVYISPIPIWNNNNPLVRQRQAEHQRAMITLQQAQQRTVAQVRAAVAKWNGAIELVNETAGLAQEVSEDVASINGLFEAGQTDLTKLMQARQRLIQLENNQLDAVWAATQAQADLLIALGARTLIETASNQAERQDVAPATPPATTAPAPPTAPPAAAPGPFRPSAAPTVAPADRP
ncbi:MAG TPA: TolC family protein [Isosphaeraceae bacterium]|jgi:cobalt-zinc-cadmium efflux system outer membrane protein|nr:TolC family protein [Isosphaeraceae bacterium]